jgi:hypothetical protein
LDEILFQILNQSSLFPLNYLLSIHQLILKSRHLFQRLFQLIQQSLLPSMLMFQHQCQFQLPMFRLRPFEQEQRSSLLMRVRELVIS